MGGYSTTAGIAVPGPYGVLNPKGERAWITLMPLEGESTEAWSLRAKEAIERVEGFCATVPSAPSPAPRRSLRPNDGRKQDGATRFPPCGMLSF